MLMLLIPVTFGAAAYVMREAAPVAAPAAPAELTPTSGDSAEVGSGTIESDDSQSSSPQESAGEVIGVPLYA
jgi:hypothetical protein